MLSVLKEFKLQKKLQYFVRNDVFWDKNVKTQRVTTTESAESNDCSQAI